jgi:hypothetical protein
MLEKVMRKKILSFFTYSFYNRYSTSAKNLFFKGINHDNTWKGKDDDVVITHIDNNNVIPFRNILHPKLLWTNHIWTQFFFIFSPSEQKICTSFICCVWIFSKGTNTLIYLSIGSKCSAREHFLLGICHFLWNLKVHFVKCLT